ncbi:hypothetical protein Tco_0054524 [Tanacetum coccineum]
MSVRVKAFHLIPHPQVLLEGQNVARLHHLKPRWQSQAVPLDEKTWKGSKGSKGKVENLSMFSWDQGEASGEMEKLGDDKERLWKQDCNVEGV